MDTPQQRFDALIDRVGTLYGEGRQREALDLLAGPDPAFEPWSADIAHLVACLHGSLGESAAALQVLRDASAAGAWWDPSILTGDDDLAGLQALPEFQELVTLSASRRTPDPRPALIQLPEGAAERRAAARPGALALNPKPLAGDPPPPEAGVVPAGVVVALHGAGQSAATAAADWAGVLALGYALVCVESSQRMTPMYRTWPERERAVEDIARALDELPAELRELPLIAAGFSAGGRAALDWALTAQPAKAAGVIVVAPALRELPGEAQNKLQPAAVLIGEDDDLLEVVDNAAEQLAAFGLHLERVPDLTHEFPQDLGERLRELLPSCG